MILDNEGERGRKGRKRRRVCKSMFKVEQERRNRKEGRVGTGKGDKRRRMINCEGECVCGERRQNVRREKGERRKN